MKKVRKIGFFLLTGMLVLTFKIQPVRASFEFIVIDPNGTVWGTCADKDKLARDGDVYTFFGNINCDGGIQVQREGIIIDGDGYILQGSGYGNGFYLFDVNNVKIHNTKIDSFYSGITFDGNTPNNLICRNTIRNCNTGIDMTFMVVGMPDSNSNNKFYHNNFINNDNQVCLSEVSATSIWDNGYQGYLSGGNYWSDYDFVCDVNNGLDQNIPEHHDGICDKPYEIDGDANNIDKFPLMYPYEVSVRNTETGLGYYTIQEAINEASPGDTIHVSGTYLAYPDLNGDGRADFVDFAIFAEQWMAIDCCEPDWCGGADLDEDGDVNGLDLGIFVSQWRPGCARIRSYYENVDVNRQVQLIGDGAGRTIIDGIRKQSIQADDVVEITADHTRIEGFTIKNAGYGKCGLNLSGSQFNHIINNRIIHNSKSGYGVGLYSGSNYNTIVNNYIPFNGNVGIDINGSRSHFIT